MLIQSVFYDGKKVKIKYEKNNGDVMQIISSEEPDTDLKDGIGNLAPVLVRALQIRDPEGYEQLSAQRVSTCGLSVKASDSGDLYKIQGFWFIPDTRDSVDVESPTLRHTADPDFFSRNSPEKFPKYLTESDSERIFKVLNAAARFIDGARAQKELDIGREEQYEAMDSDLFELESPEELKGLPAPEENFGDGFSDFKDGEEDF
ncbi:MAG: hypothetical protein ACTTJW_01170 [Sphaerochaeta sp.]